jgi:hypothetical protein
MGRKTGEPDKILEGCLVLIPGRNYSLPFTNV